MTINSTVNTTIAPWLTSKEKLNQRFQHLKRQDINNDLRINYSDQPRDIQNTRDYLVAGLAWDRLAQPDYIYNAFLYNNARHRRLFSTVYRDNYEYFFLNICDLDHDHILSGDEYFLWQEIMAARTIIDNSWDDRPLTNFLQKIEDPSLPLASRQAYANISYFFAQYLGHSESFPLPPPPSFLSSLKNIFLEKLFMERIMNKLDDQIFTARQKVFDTNFNREEIENLAGLYQRRIFLLQAKLISSSSENNFGLKSRIISDLTVLNILLPGDEGFAYLFVNYLNAFCTVPQTHIDVLNQYLSSFQLVEQAKKTETFRMRYFANKYPGLNRFFAGNQQRTKSFAGTKLFFKNLVSQKKLNKEDVPLALEKFFISRFSYSADPAFFKTLLPPEKFFELNRGVCDDWSFAFYELLKYLDYPCEFFAATRQGPSGHAFVLFPLRDRYYIFQETGIDEINYPSRDEALRNFRTRNNFTNIFIYTENDLSKSTNQAIEIPAYQSDRHFYFEPLLPLEGTRSWTDIIASKILGVVNKVLD
jgi:hypothetical protein